MKVKFGKSSFLFLIFVFVLTLCLVSGQEDESAQDNEAEVTVTKSKSVPEQNEFKSNGKKGKTSKTARLLQSLDSIKGRVQTAREIVVDIVDSFMGRGGETDADKLEQALAKYDEMVEDIEADFTKTKLNIGLRLENNLRQVNESAGRIIEKFREINPDFVDWAIAKRNNVSNDLRKRILAVNDLLGMGVERFLEVSEKGKDALRTLHKRRSAKKEKLSRLLKGRMATEST